MNVEEPMDMFLEIVKNHAKMCESCNAKLKSIIDHAYEDLVGVEEDDN